MTLCVLWRSEGRIHMASDSRMSFGAHRHADVGVKVMRLPIRVVGTNLDDTGHLAVLFERTYGFCYAGSLANAATFKQLVEDLLLNVQYLPVEPPLSFDELCGFLCHFCAKVSTEVVATLTENGRYTFCVAGQCPLNGRLRGARFYLSQADGQTHARFEEVALENGQYVVLGTGAAEFEALIAGQQATMRGVLLALNRVIDDRTAPGVGGDIQYGTFNADANFSVSGITRVSTEEADDGGRHYGPSEHRIFRYRGFELYEGWRALGERFWPSPGFIELRVPSNENSKTRFVEHCRRVLLDDR